jgi:hypothetical protein
MSVYSGPEISNDGLVFAYDMGNSQKSWIGRPTTNFVNAITTPISRYNNPGFSGSVFNTGETFKGMPIWETVFIPQDSTFIPRLASTEGFGAFHAMGTSLTVNTRYMASIYFRLISPLQVSGTQGFNNTYSNISAWGQNGTASTRYEEDGWIRLYSQFINASSTLTDNKFWKITFDTTGVQAGQALRAQWSCPMIEQHDTVYPSTFVNGTRSNTQAITDLTGNNAITATALTYNTDGTFSFNGTTDYLSIPNTQLGNGNIAWTVSCWMKTTTAVNALGLGSVLSNISGGPVYSMMGVNSGKIVYWTYQNSAWSQKLGIGKTVNDGNWHMLTWVNYSNSTMDMYVDGLLDSNVANSTSGNNNPVDVIGRSWAGYFPGSIASLTRYNRAISAAEVQQNFAALRGRYGI